MVADRVGTSPVVVQMGPVYDGVAPHMRDYAEERSFRVADEPEVDVARVLEESGAEILLCYVPVGSTKAAQAYAEACLEAGVSFVNCMPVLIVSDPQWGERFRAAGFLVLVPAAGFLPAFAPARGDAGRARPRFSRTISSRPSSSRTSTFTASSWEVARVRPT